MTDSKEPAKRRAPVPLLVRGCVRPWQQLACVLAVGSAACDAESGPKSPVGVAQRGQERVGGHVVSTVEGHAITIADIEELTAQGVSKERALSILQSERLLIQEAKRRGLESDPAVATVFQQALAQQVLVEEVEAPGVSEEEIRAAYEAAGTRYRRGERRASFHVLARLGQDATPERAADAKALIEEIIGELRIGTFNAGELRGRYQKKRRGGFRLVAEVIPPAGRNAPLEQPYLDAIFAAAEPGVVPRPVRTSFGWHAILVTKIDPARDIPIEEVRGELTKRTLLKRRRERVAALLKELGSTVGVEMTPGVEELLASVDL